MLLHSVKGGGGGGRNSILTRNQPADPGEERDFRRKKKYFIPSKRSPVITYTYHIHIYLHPEDHPRIFLRATREKNNKFISSLLYI